MSGLAELDAEIVRCRACPRLVAWREEVARVKRRAFMDQEYWGRPVPGFGDRDPWLMIVGLAPAAHGANRTGRIFTGDRSGDVLFAALHRAGLANQPTAVSADDGLRLTGCRVASAVRCAPPANKPTPQERDRCLPFLRRELDLVAGADVLLALGAFGWDAALRALEAPRPWPRFGHGAHAEVGGRRLVGCYHPSQQNTFTGRLTPAMLDDVLALAATLSRRSADGKIRRSADRG
ncbi:MAG TPA: uracil-DNA glycosylase [Miltoncostaeaceae bacterium]|nr:uracil-DNA glycosylase [Miltoncostaeaceae bacterium]